MNGIDEAIQKAGSQTELARLLGITQQTVSVWAVKGKVSPAIVPKLSKLFGIERARLNDLFADDNPNEAA